MVRLVIADDQPVVCEGMKRIMADTQDLQIVGEARTGRELFEIVARQPCDVVLLELLLPDQSGLEVLEHLRHRFPKLPVVVFSAQPKMHYAVRAFKAGAAGYLTKRSLPKELVRAIRKVVRRGGRYVSPLLAERLLAEREEEAATPLHTRLSNREYFVLCGIAAGKTIKELAAELSVVRKVSSRTASAPCKSST